MDNEHCPCWLQQNIVKTVIHFLHWSYTAVRCLCVWGAQPCLPVPTGSDKDKGRSREAFCSDRLLDLRVKTSKAHHRYRRKFYCSLLSRIFSRQALTWYIYESMCGPDFMTTPSEHTNKCVNTSTYAGNRHTILSACECLLTMIPYHQLKWVDRVEAKRQRSGETLLINSKLRMIQEEAAQRTCPSWEKAPGRRWIWTKQSSNIWSASRDLIILFTAWNSACSSLQSPHPHRS